jgi:hypothetical protein
LVPDLPLTLPVKGIGFECRLLKISNQFSPDAVLQNQSDLDGLVPLSGARLKYDFCQVYYGFQKMGLDFFYELKEMLYEGQDFNY